ncbi:DUF1653 domain-containing protein [Herbiconiux sp. 11R-BC]|uniref:DUF1653 domain-containing protein n=1 Tax=Herbiconiux sp. 11R-BC TaxID=3111637 RepID=UPI003C046D1E
MVDGEAERPVAPQVAPGRYRHYKGNDYEVIGVARHSETEEPLVVYRPLYGDGGLWVRPLAMFTETVEVSGAVVPRFARLP